MSIAPPGYTTDEPDLGSGSRQADDHVQHEFKTVQALRGRESSAKAKWQDQGWEFVSENRGTLRTELNFRRVKPKTVGAYLLSFVATFRRSQPKTQQALVASCALILVIGIIGIVVGTQSGGDTPNPSAAQTTASTTPPAETTVTAITVDELLDKLNSANMGGIKIGDQFRVTAELSGSDYWGTGASGDFSVNLKAKGGANDLPVFVDESDANGWQDGTKVEMVVKMVEVTINGETTDGFFEAQSAKTISGGTIKEAKEADTRQKSKPEMTSGQENALESAQSYVDMSGFSKARLIQQLSSSAGEGFSKADATFAANHVDADWNKEAVESAQSYLDISGFSKKRLIQQLSSSAGEKFTPTQARYAVNKVY